jgi:ribulose 1,5-bisphosphate carboxylase large subunit-like protein
MEPIRIHSHPKTHGLSVVEPVTKLELELLTKYRRLSSDDQKRVLAVLQAMASLKQAE